MIARLKGRLVAKTPGEIVVDVGGVGYQVFVTLTTFYGLPAPGGEVTLDVHTHVREDAIQLYGFGDPQEREVFRLLLTVSGIGPRLATNVLSGIPPDDMIRALTDGDVARLVAVPGVGRKLADRLTVELKDRAALLRGNGRDRGRSHGTDRGTSAVVREATSALVNLGYRLQDAERAATQAADAGADRLEDVIRRALRGLST
jgi:Holliday junction DNA helicase RuvA